MSVESKVIYVEKRKPYDIEAKQLCHDFITNLQIANLQYVRLIKKYLVSKIDTKTYTVALKTVFHEPQVDSLSNKISIQKGETVFAVALLPGQFDQRADSAEQCLKLINPQTEAFVKSIDVIILGGTLIPEEIEKIKKYYINPTDSIEVDVKNDSAHQTAFKPLPIKTIASFIKWNDKQITKFHLEQKLAMSIADLILIQQYFRKLKRDPTITEIKVIDTYWSDHCRHTTFETQIKKVSFPKGPFAIPVQKAYEEYLKTRSKVYGNKTSKICLMDIATIVTKLMRKQKLLPELDVSEENNACSIKTAVNIAGKKHPYYLMFKNETHNHPTEIEPYGGAATCLGGAIRDPLSGRSYVYQAMRVTGSADPTLSIERTLSHKLPQRKIVLGAAKGYSSYGNQIGLATGSVDEIYHPNYVAKHMEIGAVIGAVPQGNIIRETPSVGDQIILLGGRTGKDGIGGATGSSQSHNEQSISNSGPEVQKGNPTVERKIQRLFKNIEVTKLIKKCNDFGAGGVSVAIGELCPGVDINLDLIPKKYLGLNGTELAISESQERMAVVVSQENANRFLELANGENLEATVVASVTNTNHLRMFWQDKKIVDLDRKFLNTNGATQSTNVAVEDPTPYPFSANASSTAGVATLWKNMLKDLNVCSKIGLIQRFDSTIGANTVLMPLGGKYQLTPAEGMVATIPTFGKPTNSCSLMTYGFNPYVGEWSPFHMAYYSIIESVTKIVALGGEWRQVYLSLQEYFEKMKNENSWGKPFAALLGAFTAQRELNIPAIGGKDSMSGSYESMNVPPTLVSFAVCTEQAENIISPEFKKTDSVVILVKPKYLTDGMIDIQTLKDNFDAVKHGISRKSILAAYSLKTHGIAEGITKMCMGNKIGVQLKRINKSMLFGIWYGALIVEVSKKAKIKELFAKANYEIIGETMKEPSIVCKDDSLNLKIDEVINLSAARLESVFEYNSKQEEQKIELKPFLNKVIKKSKVAVKKPLVVMPVFPGTNCEFDSQQAWEKAGAEVKQVLIRNLNSEMLLESIDTLASAIDEANIVMIPGGFSAGDEPDGSAKFIANVFRNEKIKKAIESLLNKRDGLMLGICNGFQALVKLGLLPHGKIMDATETSPTLTYNDIQHHMSCIVRTKIVSNKSPWLSAWKPGDVHAVPISHGEGKFIASLEQIKKLEKNGQIATQYVNLNNNATMLMPFNPNGSLYAVEGITSQDGRIFGKMGHSERIGPNLYKNVIDKYDQKIFECGVKYFSRSK